MFTCFFCKNYLTFLSNKDISNHDYDYYTCLMCCDSLDYCDIDTSNFSHVIHVNKNTQEIDTVFLSFDKFYCAIDDYCSAIYMHKSDDNLIITFAIKTKIIDYTKFSPEVLKNKLQTYLTFQ